MVHPATLRVVTAALTALGVPLDVGIVFPPKPGETRGRGQWTNRDLGPAEITAMLPRLAEGNTRGGNVYLRLGPGAKALHPGIVMLDDLSRDAVQQLSRDGLEPCLVVETSTANFQAWIRLVQSACVPYAIMTEVARHLARTYHGDERAVSPRQPGRLPGFTNRKPKHQLTDGRYPFVRLVQASAGRTASAGAALLERVSSLDTGGAAGGAAPETPLGAAETVAELDPATAVRLDAIYIGQRERILREVASGRRPVHAASASEIDFATARAALTAGDISRDDIVAWLADRRSREGSAYPERTVRAASSFGPGVR